MPKKIWLLIIIFGFIVTSANSQVKPEQLKANWIFIISENVTFKNEAQIDTFKIAVYGKNSPVYNEIINISANRKIKGKPVKISNINKLNQVENYNIIYIDESKNDFIETIFKKIKGTGALMITYKVNNQDFIMINLLFNGLREQFQIQSANLYDEHITANEKLLALGGTKVDLQKLFDKKVKELDKKEKELKKQEELLSDKETELNALIKQIEKQQLRNEEQANLLNEKQKEVIKEKEYAQQLLEEVAKQKVLIKRNKDTLVQQNKYIEEKKILIKKQIKELDSTKKELTLQQKRIKKQKDTLNLQNERIDNQEQIIYIISVAIIIFILLLSFALYLYFKNKKITNKLKLKNSEINKQKDEILKQAKQVKDLNKELFKLSLVASQTQNSVVIMDKTSRFEWINSGFTRMYGYTLQLLRNELGNYLYEIGGDTIEREKILKKCIKTKKTQVYEAKNRKRTGEVIWVQTSLTPVLDNENNITKLIAIESNITKLKEQENEIIQKNEELSEQKSELENQKNILQAVNIRLKDSINYALTIQKSILPPEKEIKKYFENFLIYLPKDIVSGDFYWFNHFDKNTYFLAAVDCTGHGVPGAFMSLIASRMLDEIVVFQKISNPDEILCKLNNLIIKTLNQETSNNRDGMDLGLVRIVKNKNKTINLCFAGAKRPLIYYQKEEDKLNLIKGNRRSIGGMQASQNKLEFKQEAIILKENDIIYLSSDGMIDQNNEKRKRFGTPKFLNLIKNNVNKSLENQKIEILKEFEKFKTDEPQRDDIIVWGIKL